MKKDFILKANKQRACIFIGDGKKVYQVALDKQAQDSLLFFIPQLFEDGIIKVLPNDFSMIKLPKLK